MAYLKYKIKSRFEFVSAGINQTVYKSLKMVIERVFDYIYELMLN